MHTRSCWENLCGKENFEDIGLDTRIKLKLILIKYNGRAWAGFICVGIGTCGGSCDYRNEPLDSIKCKISSLAEELLASQE
jgi:hypothetical protein